MKNKLTEDKIKLVYDVSKQYYLGTCTKKFAIELLVTNGINKNSASDYIHYFTCMLDNKSFKRSISSKLLEYYLDNMYNDFGLKVYCIAMTTISNYLIYYASIGKKLNKLIAIHRNSLEKYPDAKNYILNITC